MGECLLVRRGGGKPTLKGISVKTPPTKLEYLVGDTFDPTGMVLTANVGGVPVDVTTGYTVTPDPLTADTTMVTISYTAGGNTVTTTQAITIKLFNPIFANNSWELIIEACQSGDAKTLWSIGDEKTVTIGEEEYTLQILGFDHYSLSSSDTKYGDSNYNGGSNKAALCLGLKDTLNTTYAYCNSTYSENWHNSTLYGVLNNTIMPTMPSEIVSGIRLVSVLTYSSGKEYSTNDKIIVPSSFEILGKTSTARAKYANKEGTQYAYYLAGNSAIKKHNETANVYWTRSMHYSDDWRTSMCYITADGTNTGSKSGATSYPVSFVINL